MVDVCDVDGIGKMRGVDGIVSVNIGNIRIDDEVMLLEGDDIGEIIRSVSNCKIFVDSGSSLSVTAEHMKSSSSNISELMGWIPEFLKPLSMLTWVKMMR